MSPDSSIKRREAMHSHWDKRCFLLIDIGIMSRWGRKLEKKAKSACMSSPSLPYRKLVSLFDLIIATPSFSPVSALQITIIIILSIVLGTRLKGHKRLVDQHKSASMKSRNHMRQSVASSSESSPQ